MSGKTRCPLLNNKHCSHLVELEALKAERDRLQGIVDRLPKAADGVEIAHGDTLWNRNGAPVYVAQPRFGGYCEVGFGVVLAGLYSTREAAEAAKEKR